MTLIDVYIHAEERGIEIDDVPLRAVPSASYPEGWIMLDRSKIETETEEKVALAHEIGHIETASFYNLYSTFDLKSKHEKRADIYAIKKLIPYKEIRSAVRSGLREVWELAEHFEVTEDFMRKAVDYYADRSHRAG